MTVRTPLWRVAALVVAAAAVAACGSSSTGPAGPTAAQTAAHIDSIYSALLAAGTPGDSQLAGVIAVYIETAPAFGATQTSFTATTASGTQTWQGFTIASQYEGDTAFLTTVYPANSSLGNFFLSINIRDSTGDEGALGFLVFDSTGGVFTSVESSAPPTVANTITSLGAACSLETGLAADSVITTDVTVDVTSCNLINTTYSATAQFTSSAMPAADASLTFSSVPVHGVLFGGTLLGPDRAPRGPTIASARVRALVDMVRQRQGNRH
jgi:hypothetical protein